MTRLLLILGVLTLAGCEVEGSREGNTYCVNKHGFKVMFPPKFKVRMDALGHVQGVEGIGQDNKPFYIDADSKDWTCTGADGSVWKEGQRVK